MTKLASKCINLTNVLHLIRRNITRNPVRCPLCYGTRMLWEGGKRYYCEDCMEHVCRAGYRMNVGGGK